MSYSLTQTPVPTWAVPNRVPVDIDPEQLPAFLFPAESHATQSNGTQQRPVFLKNTGRWNSVIQESKDPHDKKVTIDPTILEKYELGTKWENKLDSEADESSGIANLERLRERFLKNLSSNPFFPIALRGSASAFAIITLGLACAVYVQTKKVGSNVTDPSLTGHSPGASTIFCIVISTISIVYLLFSLWDETFGQPLGLRPSHSKIKFVAIDLALICFTAANLAVSFDSMISKNYICPAHQNPRVCKLHKGVISFIFVTLCVWFLTFLVSTFRMIDRATH